MTLLIRIFLISLIIYLFVRSFMRFGEPDEEIQQKKEPENKNIKGDKKISKKIGEYIDYEEID